jgi:hypothetical protein
MRVLVLSFIGLVIAGTGAINAQILPDSLRDHRIRVHFVSQGRSLEGFAPRQALRGVLADVTGDSVTIRFHPDASPVTVSVNGIHQIDLSRGVSRSRTAIRHAVFGAVYLGSLGSMNDHELGGGTTENYLIWAGGGFLIGIVMGIVRPEEHWKRVFRG